MIYTFACDCCILASVVVLGLILKDKLVSRLICLERKHKSLEDNVKLDVAAIYDMLITKIENLEDDALVLHGKIKTDYDITNRLIDDFYSVQAKCDSLYNDFDILRDKCGFPEVVRKK